MNKQRQVNVLDYWNRELSLEWKRQTALDISNQAEAKHPVGDETYQLLVFSDSQIYVRFDTADTGEDTIVDANEMIFPETTGDPAVIPIPRGLGSAIVFRCKQVQSAAGKSVRIVEQ